MSFHSSRDWGESGTVPTDGSEGARPWLGVYFKCSGSYLRVFRSADGSGYRARCPRCTKCITFAVGSGGTSRRFFEVSC